MTTCLHDTLLTLGIPPCTAMACQQAKFFDAQSFAKWLGNFAPDSCLTGALVPHHTNANLLKIAAGSPQAKIARPLIVSEDGCALSKSALNSAWRRAMAIAIDAGQIINAERFGLHGIKHRSITDTPGTKADKKQASGHKSDAMVELYDHEVPTVDPVGKAR